MLKEFWSTFGDSLIMAYSISSTILIFIVGFMIFMEKKNPYKTIAWLAIITVFPVLGLIVYLMFGQNLRRRRKIIRSRAMNDGYLEQIVNRQIECIDSHCLDEAAGNEKKQLIKLLLKNAKAPLTRSNHVEILSNGQEAFASIFTELEKACHHIHLEYYIFKDDHLGQKLKETLIRKAKAGVKVRVIFDAVGSWKLSHGFIGELKAAGVEIRPFLPVIMPFINNKLNYRNHRKIVVIDGKTGFMGGLNIGDEYLGFHPKLGKWRDTHLKLIGSSVYFLQVIFLMDWEFVSGTRLLQHSDTDYFPVIESFQGKMVQIAASGPDSDWESIRQSYFALITSAQKSINITTPYLIPDEGISLALKTAALSGVDIKIIVPGINDHKVVRWASQSYFDELMEAGIEIYLYRPGFIHAKIISVDGEVASLGSANLDMRSFQLNFEVNAMLYDHELVAILDHSFALDLAQSAKVDYEEFCRRPLISKMRQSAARLLSPIL